MGGNPYIGYLGNPYIEYPRNTSVPVHIYERIYTIAENLINYYRSFIRAERIGFDLSSLGIDVKEDFYRSLLREGADRIAIQIVQQEQNPTRYSNISVLDGFLLIARVNREPLEDLIKRLPRNVQDYFNQVFDLGYSPSYYEIINPENIPGLAA